MGEATDRWYVCPLCSHKFHGAGCHADCYMSTGCNKVRCPNCTYEFVEEGSLATLLRRVFGLKQRDEGDSATTS